MKKLTAILMAFLLCIGITACGSSDKDTSKDSAKEDVKKTERSIDAVAEELGLSNGSETLYQLIGAENGKEYNSGAVELYQFDVSSDEYKAIEEGTGSIKAAACNDGFIIVFSKEQDDDMIKAFKDMVFK